MQNTLKKNKLNKKNRKRDYFYFKKSKNQKKFLGYRRKYFKNKKKQCLFQ